VGLPTEWALRREGGGVEGWERRVLGVRVMEGAYIEHLETTALSKRSAHLLRETPAQNLALRALKREYKKALRIHTRHVRVQVQLRLEETEDEIVAAAQKNRSQDRVKELCAQKTAMEAYEGDLVANNNFALARVEDGEPAGLFYAQMDAPTRVDFWKSRFIVDTFVSFLWEFSGVLHFR
jgi:hypothetical protein